LGKVQQERKGEGGKVGEEGRLKVWCLKEGQERERVKRCLRTMNLDFVDLRVGPLPQMLGKVKQERGRVKVGK
jgi:hypothetical protein